MTKPKSPVKCLSPSGKCPYIEGHCDKAGMCLDQGQPIHEQPPWEYGVLDKAKELVDGRDKQDHYGPPEEFMGRLSKVWGGYLGVELKPTDAALMMALLKACRLRTDPSHADSLVDFAGYAHIYERVK